MTARRAEARRVLLTGGARGIGAAIARMLAQEGHDVTFTYRRDTTAAGALVHELSAQFPDQKFAAEPLDLTDRSAIDDFLAGIDGQPPFTAFVHNAGQSYDSLAAVMDQDKAQALMQVNFWSFATLAGALVRPMTRARAGRVVAIGSIAALRANRGNAAYAASKAALLGYVRTLAVETARRGVTVNYVAPGFVDTDMMKPYASHRDTMEKQIPVGRFADPAEIGAVVAFLLSRAAGYVTGAVLAVDGGLSAAIGIHR